MIGLYGEFRFNIVSMDLDVETDMDTGMAYNNWMLVAGYRISL